MGKGLQGLEGQEEVWLWELWVREGLEGQEEVWIWELWVRKEIILGLVKR